MSENIKRTICFSFFYIKNDEDVKDVYKKPVQGLRQARYLKESDKFKHGL